MIPAWFTAQLARMADLRNAPSALTMWWEGLQGVPPEVLEAAVTHAIVTRTFFPTPAELREDADVAYRRPVEVMQPKTRALAEPVMLGTLPTGAPIVARRELVYHCEDCGDTGWRRSVDRDAEGMPERLWVGRCACWGENPVLVRKREAQAKYASGRTR